MGGDNHKRIHTHTILCTYITNGSAFYADNCSEQQGWKCSNTVSECYIFYFLHYNDPLTAYAYTADGPKIDNTEG